MERESGKVILKRITAVLMAVVMLLCVAPLEGVAELDFSSFSVSAEDDHGEIVATGNCGTYEIDYDDNVSYTFYEDGTLVIKGEGETADYLSYECPFGDLEIKNVVIEPGVTRIGNCMFYGSIGLTSLTLPNSVTSIGSNAFYGCERLADITIPDSVTNIGTEAFNGTAWYNSQPDGVVYAGKVAYNYKGEMPEETSVVIKDGTLAIADNAFCERMNLIDITIPDSVKTVGYFAFFATGWYDLQPDGVVYAGKVVYEYKGEMPENTIIVLKEGTLSLSDYAFDECPNLTGITIPDSVISIGKYAFNACTSLESITIGSSVTSIGIRAFDDCTSLASVYITDIASWCNIDFSNYASTPLNNGATLYLNSEIVTDLTIPDSVTSIGDYAFHGCTSLISVTIPNSVISIGKVAFSTCSYIASVTIGNGVESIGDKAFYKCNSIVSITIPDSATSIGDYAFDRCTNLENITICNPECEIYDSDWTIYSTATIYGYANSTAQAYAEEYDRTFVALCPTNHKNTTDYEEVSATCTTDGHTAGLKCDDCGEWLSGEVIKAAHINTDGNNICDLCKISLCDIFSGETKTIEIVADEITYLIFTLLSLILMMILMVIFLTQIKNRFQIMMTVIRIVIFQ